MTFTYDYNRPALKEIIDRLTELYEQQGDMPVIADNDGYQVPMTAEYIDIAEEKIDGVKCKRVVL